jgi:hypothetical protein
MKAHTNYQAARKEIDAKLREIQALLQKLDEREAKDSANWGFAGTAGHILEELTEIANHLS